MKKRKNGASKAINDLILRIQACKRNKMPLREGQIRNEPIGISQNYPEYFVDACNGVLLHRGVCEIVARELFRTY
jgi:hypothetical protein